jgi:hypothetical protein
MYHNTKFNQIPLLHVFRQWDGRIDEDQNKGLRIECNTLEKICRIFTQIRLPIGFMIL